MGRSRARAITSRSDFRNIFKSGRIVRSSHLAAHVVEDPGREHGRLAVVVSRKHGGAVERNRIRRRMREAIRLRGGPPGGTSSVFVAREGAGKLRFDEVATEVNQIMERIEREINL